MPTRVESSRKDHRSQVILAQKDHSTETTPYIDWRNIADRVEVILSEAETELAIEEQRRVWQLIRGDKRGSSLDESLDRIMTMARLKRSEGVGARLTAINRIDFSPKEGVSIESTEPIRRNAYNVTGIDDVGTEISMGCTTYCKVGSDEVVRVTYGFKDGDLEAQGLDPEIDTHPLTPERQIEIAQALQIKT